MMVKNNVRIFMIITVNNLIKYIIKKKHSFKKFETINFNFLLLFTNFHIFITQILKVNIFDLNNLITLLTIVLQFLNPPFLVLFPLYPLLRILLTLAKLIPVLDHLEPLQSPQRSILVISSAEYFLVQELEQLEGVVAKSHYVLV